MHLKLSLCILTFFSITIAQEFPYKGGFEVGGNLSCSGDEYGLIFSISPAFDYCFVDHVFIGPITTLTCYEGDIGFDFGGKLGYCFTINKKLFPFLSAGAGITGVSYISDIVFFVPVSIGLKTVIGSNLCLNASIDITADFANQAYSGGLNIGFTGIF
jgi:hypothetical protein